VIDRAVAFRAACFIVSGQGGDAFEDGRFSDAVLAHDNRDAAIEFHGEFRVPKDRQAKWIG
jgi:hypothetical protein